MSSRTRRQSLVSSFKAHVYVPNIPVSHLRLVSLSFAGHHSCWRHRLQLLASCHFCRWHFWFSPKMAENNGFSIRILVNFEIFQLLQNISFSITMLKSPFYSWQTIWALKCLRERFNDSLKILKFTRICADGKTLKRDWVARVVFLIQILLIFGDRCNRYFWDVRLNSYRLLNFNTLFFSSCWQHFPKANHFRVFTKLITWPTTAKGLLPKDPIYLLWRLLLVFFSACNRTYRHCCWNRGRNTAGCRNNCPSCPHDSAYTGGFWRGGGDSG